MGGAFAIVERCALQLRDTRCSIRAMTEPNILVLDEGTTSTRAILFSPTGKPLGTAQRDITQHFPKPGWVEQDAGEIWDKTLQCAREAVTMAGGPDAIAAIAIANQRETVVAWDKATGKPLARAIVWQDRRTAAACAAMREKGLEPDIQRRTGLVLDPYFSGTKMAWLLEREPAVASAAKAGTLAFGTVESWLIWNLTGGAHLSDATNASRTLLLPLDGAQFDLGLCEAFGVPFDSLPEVTDNIFAGSLHTDADLFGTAIPLCASVGDQQAATIGQGCLRKGETKATYGTGAFVLANRGAQVPQSDNRLLGTVLMQEEGVRTYALEGSVFAAGSLVQWLRDGLGLFDDAADTEALARSIPDNGGVAIVPGMAGLGAPHWLPDARGVIAGLSFSTGKAQIARAALEAMAHQTYDLANAFAADGVALTGLKIDGGMAANDWMAQDIANLLGLTVERPDFVETTALGAAILAAVGAGLYPDLVTATSVMRGRVSTFEPAMEDKERAKRIEGWQRALLAV